MALRRQSFTSSLTDGPVAGTPGGDPTNPIPYGGLPGGSPAPPAPPQSPNFQHQRGGPGDLGLPFVGGGPDLSGNWQQQGGAGGGGYTNWAAYLYANPLSQPSVPQPNDAQRTPGMQNLDAGLNTAYFGQESQWPGGKYPGDSSAPPAATTPAAPPTNSAAGQSGAQSMTEQPGGIFGVSAPGEQQSPQKQQRGFLGSLLTRSA